MQEGEITQWHVTVGQAIGEGDVLADIETDKINAELEAPAAGVIETIIVPAGDTARVGEVVATIRTTVSRE